MPQDIIELDDEKLQKLPLVQKLIDFVEKYSANKRIIRKQLDGNFAMQIASSATQIPGYVFLEVKSVKARDKYGTS